MLMEHPISTLHTGDWLVVSVFDNRGERERVGAEDGVGVGDGMKVAGGLGVEDGPWPTQWMAYPSISIGHQ